MIRVPALAPHDGTIFSGILDSGADAFKGRLTNAAHVVVGVPAPGSDGVESLEADFECHGRWRVVFQLRGAAAFAGGRQRRIVVGEALVANEEAAAGQRRYHFCCVKNPRETDEKACCLRPPDSLYVSTGLYGLHSC